MMGQAQPPKSGEETIVIKTGILIDFLGKTKCQALHIDMTEVPESTGKLGCGINCRSSSHRARDCSQVILQYMMQSATWCLFLAALPNTVPQPLPILHTIVNEVTRTLHFRQYYLKNIQGSKSSSALVLMHCSHSLSVNGWPASSLTQIGEQ